MHWLKSLSAGLGHFLVLYGGWGLLAINLLDSSFVPFPVLNDLLLIHLSSQHPGRFAVYALQATIGSIGGSFVMYGLGRGGGTILWRKAPPQAIEKAQRWLTRNDFVAMLVASLLPPPAPYKVFVLTAGMLRMNAASFGIALFVGRGLRFSVEGLLGARYGAEAETYLRGNAAWVSLVAALLVVSSVWLYRRFSRRSGAAAAAVEPRSGTVNPAKAGLDR
ncbi:MAG TPA: VTT domain-containing protein [Terriglobia bacterium]|nr:VTT domain-containing protein [Terriglobia bacterium]